MNQNKKNNSNIVKVLIFLLLISFILYYIDNLKVSIDSYTAEIDLMEDKILTKAILVKDEEIYSSDYVGNIKYYFEEGERIKTGSLLATIYLNNQESKTNEELSKIERAIELKENNLDNDNNFEIVNELEKEVQNLLMENKKEEAFRIIETYRSESSLKNEYTSLSLLELKEKRKDLISNISENNINIYSKSSGIISYQIDNTENIYNVDRLDRYNSNDYNILEIRKENLKENIIGYGDPIIKIVNNFKWYIMFNIETKENIEDKYLNIRLNKIDRIVVGEVYKNIQDDGKRFLIVKLDRYFNEFLEDRYTDIEVILDKYEGIKIKKSSIIEKDNLEGVYVVGASKIVRFYPIKPLGIGDEYIIIDEGSSHTINSRGQIEVNGENYYTVKLYDKIISNPDDVKEGQILK